MKVTLEYLAGFFDGEGSIYISKRAPRHGQKSPHHVLYVNLVNTNPLIPAYCYKTFGGSYVHVKRTGNNRDAFIWVITGDHARNFLYYIKPCLKLKAAQARAALKLKEFRRRGHFILPKREVSRREKLRLYIQRLNHTGWRNGKIFINK